MPLSSSQCLLSSFLGSREDASTTRIKPTLVGEQQIHTFAKQLLPLHTTILFLFIVLKVSTSSLVIFYNKCPHQVWPRIQPSAGKLVLARGGFKLSPNWAYSLQLPDLWFGRLWGRHDCTFDIGGHGRYTTGDYDATLAKLTLGVSLVDGYNLPISITPFKGSGKCSYEGCVSDLNTICLVDLLVCSCNNKHVVACKIRKLSLSVSFIYSRSLNAYSTIMRQEGVGALWTGIGPYIARNGIINVVELGSYDQVKQVKLRMMGDSSYKSTFDCFIKTLKNDGFIPNFGRLGSWNVIMFLTLEQVQVEYFVIAFHFSFPSYQLSHGVLVYFYSILVCCGRG
ncbi:Thaumatin-like protein [Glycine max]|nr:Thaumatin-like protein [Glycine max]